MMSVPPGGREKNGYNMSKRKVLQRVHYRGKLGETRLAIPFTLSEEPVGARKGPQQCRLTFFLPVVYRAYAQHAHLFIYDWEQKGVTELMTA